MWFTPLSILLTVIVGSALGWILVKITKTPQQLHGLVIGCCAAGNTGNLPVIIIPAVCAEKNNPFGDSFSCSRNGMAYVSLSMSIGAVFVWSYVYNIIRICGTKSDGNVQIKSTISKNQSGEINSLDSSTEELLLKCTPSSQEYEAQTAFVLKRSEDRVKVPFKQHLKSLLGYIDLRMLLTPPIVATVVGLLIVVSPLRNVMVGDSAPLRVIESSVLLLGCKKVWSEPMDHSRHHLNPVYCLACFRHSYHKSCTRSWHGGIRSFISLCSSASVLCSTCNGHRYNYPVV